MPTPKTTIRSVAKKAPVKKVGATKSVPKKSVGKKTLVYADSKTSFWIVDGQILNSLMALQNVLSSMEKEVYAHHVTKDRNDFADWVEKVLEDGDCAKALRSAKTVSSAKTVVVKHLKTYTL